MDNVIYYQDIMVRKMDAQVKYIENQGFTPEKLHRQISLLNDWNVNELSQEDDYE